MAVTELVGSGAAIALPDRPRALEWSWPSPVREAASLIAGRSDLRFRVVSWLYHGPARYSELRQSLSVDSDNRLTVALKKLQNDSIVQRVARKIGNEKVVRYNLTIYGEEVYEICQNIAPFAQRIGETVIETLDVGGSDILYGEDFIELPLGPGGSQKILVREPTSEEMVHLKFGKEVVYTSNSRGEPEKPYYRFNAGIPNSIKVELVHGC